MAKPNGSKILGQDRQIVDVEKDLEQDKAAMHGKDPNKSKSMTQNAKVLPIRNKATQNKRHVHDKDLGRFDYDVQGMTNEDFAGFMNVGYQIVGSGIDDSSDDENIPGNDFGFVSQQNTNDDFFNGHGAAMNNEASNHVLNYQNPVQADDHILPFTASDLGLDPIPRLFGDDIPGGVQILDFSDLEASVGNAPLDALLGNAGKVSDEHYAVRKDKKVRVWKSRAQK
ncbi:hypothetical protein K490DRAFT_55326 [Saccharata proteae CBS 121410]|uniref:Uncharacterized protein n=1 Tax=Saccharata proteae CBS 121410 TaxID=1314787 RepID=A0A6A5YD08_9PEZI|nr:hypothetical protein K490DRAFT_55326 [Saccharata proteae CBS 121410]